MFTKRQRVSKAQHCCRLQDTRVGNLGVTLGLAILGASELDRPDDSVGLGVALHNLAEDDVLAVEPGSHNSGDKKLGSVGVGPSICHGEEEWGGMLELEVLILELLAPNRATTGAITAGEVTTLKHELGNDTVEYGALVVFAIGATFADGSEVLSRLGDDVVEELKGDAARLIFADLVFAYDCARGINLNGWASPGAVKEDTSASHCWS